MFTHHITPFDPRSVQYRLHIYPIWRQHVGQAVLFQTPVPADRRTSPYAHERIDQWAFDLAGWERSRSLAEVHELLAEAVVQRRLPGVD